jgi:hypothetical protein
MRVANRINPIPKKGLFVRSLIAVALAEALLMGSAMAAGTDAQNMPVEDSYEVTATDDTDNDGAYNATSNLTNPLFAMGATQRGSVGVMGVSDPLIAIDGMTGTNYADLNNAASTMSALALGVNSNAGGGDTVAMGVQAIAASDNAVALGSHVTTGADQPYAVAVGSKASTNGAQAVALGANVSANADNALAVGNNNTAALSSSSIAMGDGARVNTRSDNSIAIGTSATIDRNTANAMALGANAHVIANAYGSVALGADSIADRANVLSIGSIGAERQIINVAAGTQLTDAVNVSQLKGVTDAFGAGTGVAPDGSITQPNFVINGYQYNTVEQALQAAASSGATDSQAVRYDLNDDGSTNYGSVTLGGPAASPVILTNVADGKNQYDAVNFGQLSALQGEVNNLTQTVSRFIEPPSPRRKPGPSHVGWDEIPASRCMCVRQCWDCIPAYKSYSFGDCGCDDDATMPCSIA